MALGLYSPGSTPGLTPPNHCPKELFPKVMICNSHVLQPTSLREFAFVVTVLSSFVLKTLCSCLGETWAAPDMQSKPVPRESRIYSISSDAT
jgi:hypothetical protein